MTYSSEQRQKLKAYFDSFTRQSEILGESSINSVSVIECIPITEEIQVALKEFPDLMAPFPTAALKLGGHQGFFYRGGIRSYLATALARLRAALEETSSPAGVEPLDFLFVKDGALREIIERDYIDIQSAYLTRCWKSVIILCGGSIEAILLDRLLKDQKRAKAARAAPSGNPEISRWDLADLIKVAVELKYVEPSAETLANPVRQYRNLVHPGNELRNKLTVSELEANSALNVLNIVHRDLSK